MEKINELSKEKQKIEKELNEKKKELSNNNREINNLKLQEKLLKETLDNLEKSNKLKTEEVNELKGKIDKLKEARIDKNLSKMTKMFQDTRKKDSSTMPKIFQDDENKIFPPFNDDYESDNIEKLMEEYTTPIIKEKHISDKELKKLNTFISNKKVKKLNPEYMAEIVKTNGNETTKKFYKDEIEKASSTIKFLDKKIKEDPTMPIEKNNIVNQLKKLYKLRETYFTNKFNNRPENNKNINIISIDDDISNLLDKLRDQEGRCVFTYQNEFVKL